MISTNFNPSNNILEVKYIGKVSLQEIVDYISVTKTTSEYPRTLKILTDATKANMLFSPDDVQTIVDANNESLQNYDYIIDAIIVTNPNETALSLFFKLLSENKKYKFKVFSDTQAATIWLTQKVELELI